MWAFVAAILLLLISSASAHDSWIANEKLTDPLSREICCNLRDCQEETENVRPSNGGFIVISTGEFIPSARVIWRSPGGWWRCRYTMGEKAGKTRCLIGPALGT